MTGVELKPHLFGGSEPGEADNLLDGQSGFAQQALSPIQTTVCDFIENPGKPAVGKSTLQGPAAHRKMSRHFRNVQLPMTVTPNVLSCFLDQIQRGRDRGRNRVF